MGKPVWRFPNSVAMDYEIFLLDMIDRWMVDFKGQVDHALARNGKADALGYELTNLYTNVDITLKGIPPYILAGIANKTVTFNDAQWEKITKDAFGVALLGARPELKGIIQQWVAENTLLIKKLQGDAVIELQRRVNQGFTAGLSGNAIRDLILADGSIDLLGKSTSLKKNLQQRAKLIAVDQVGSLNGQLTQLNQTAIGVKAYTWETAKDIRVRGAAGGLYPYAIPSHAARLGQRFTWDKPPEDGHPGSAIRCRCWARPDWSSMETIPPTLKKPKGL